jgi:hypothetical protein
MEVVMKIGKVFDYLILAFGIALIIYGLVIWIGQKAKLTMDYNWEKVKEEDIKKFTASYGIAYSSMGIVMTLLALSRIAFEGKYNGIVFVFYFISYFVFMFVTKKIRIKFTGSY